MKACLEYEEIARLEECATNVRDRLLIRILFHLGCRVSEALGIAVEDIELTKGLISIEHLKIRSHVFCPTCHTQLGKNHRFCPSCGAQVETAVAEAREHRRMRTLPIDKTTIQMLRDYIHRGGPVERGGRKLIFGVNRHRAWQIITKCAEKAGLPKLTNPETGRVHNVSPHRLRDSFATHAIKTAAKRYSGSTGEISATNSYIQCCPLNTFIRTDSGDNWSVLFYGKSGL